MFLHTLHDTSNHRIDFIGISITSLPLNSIFFLPDVISQAWFVKEKKEKSKKLF